MIVAEKIAQMSNEELVNYLVDKKKSMMSTLYREQSRVIRSQALRYAFLTKNQKLLNDVLGAMKADKPVLIDEVESFVVKEDHIVFYLKD